MENSCDLAYIDDEDERKTAHEAMVEAQEKVKAQQAEYAKNVNVWKAETTVIELMKADGDDAIKSQKVMME